MLKYKIERILALTGWSIQRLNEEINKIRQTTTINGLNNILNNGKPTDEEDEYLMSILTDIQINLIFTK